MANAKEVGKIVSTVAKAGKKALSSADDAVKTGAKLAGSSGRVAARNAAKYGSKAGKIAGRRKVHNARRQGGQKAANVNEGAGGWGNPKFSSSNLDDIYANATATGRSGAKASAAVTDGAAAQVGAAVTGEGGSRAVKLYKSLRTFCSDMGKGAAFVGQNWKGFAATVFGWNYFVKDKGLFEQAKGVMFTDKEMAELKNKGGVGFLKEGLFGEEGSSKSVLENTVDTLAGDGVYQTGTGIVSNTFDTVGGVVKGVTGAVGDTYVGVKGAVGDTYDGVKGYLAGNERGYLAGSEGGTQHGMPVGTDGNMSSMPIGSTIASMFSGRMLNLASLIGAGILMFGNYGTMGKLASLGLGGMALKGMNSRNSAVVQQPSRPQSYGDLRSIPVSQERVVDEAVQRALDNASDVNIVRRRI